MLEQYEFKTELTPYTKAEAVIFSAANGYGRIENNQLHICANYHFIYKFDADTAGWYMKNDETETEYYLGKGASPSVVVRDIVICDNEYFTNILYVPEEAPKTIKHSK